MSQVREMLAKRHKELKQGISDYQAELLDVEKAMRAVGVDVERPVDVREREKPIAPQAVAHSMPVNDAIIKAVEAGHKTPKSILQYLHDHLGVMTTLGSVRARVSPLGKEGKIAHDGTGWIPAGEEVSDLLS